MVVNAFLNGIPIGTSAVGGSYVGSSGVGSSGVGDGTLHEQLV